MSEQADTAGYLNMDLLRFTTAGSVDDGKYSHWALALRQQGHL